MSAVNGNQSEKAQRGLRMCLALMVALVVLKFIALLGEYEWDPARAPWFLLILVVVPAVVLSWLLGRARRVAAVIIAVAFLGFIASVIAALARDGLARQSWADYPFAYGGLIVAVVGVFFAITLVRSEGVSNAQSSYG